MSSDCGLEPAARRPHVLLGLSGSVASVKWMQLVLQLSEFADVRVLPTASALHFVQMSKEYDPASYEQLKSAAPALVEAACRPSTAVNPIARSTSSGFYLDSDEWADYKTVHTDAVLHIELRKWADVLLIAPLSANTLGKLSNGLCDNLLTSAARAWDFTTHKPFIVAPAMNTAMWEHPVTSEQLGRIAGWGVIVIPPMVKTLACGDTGSGAMESVPVITAMVKSHCIGPLLA
jgi:phosphopantothenoylcysteine decarboxylase